MIWRRRRSAFTLTEVMVIGGIALMLLLILIDLFIRSNRVLDVSARTAGSQLELESLVQTLAADVEELAYLKDGAPFDGSGSYAFAVRSDRFEPGLPPPRTAVLRRVEYALRPAGARSSVVRSASHLGASLKIDDLKATGPLATVATSVSRFKIVPLAWSPDKTRGAGFLLAPATDALARAPGAGIAALILSVTVGEPGADSASPEGVLSITTKLWCRHRLIQLGWGGVE